MGSVWNHFGTISAARNVGELLSFSTFSANVSATNAVGEIDQGRIGNVSALGVLSGSLNAAYSIGTVTSGAAISATVSAPNLGSNLPFDTAILTSLIVPTVPASVREDVLADGATALAGILADKAEFDASAQTFVADIGQEYMSLQAGISEARSDLLADNATAATETQGELDTDRQTAETELATARNEAATARQELEADADTRRTAAQNAWTAAANANSEAFNASRLDSLTA